MHLISINFSVVKKPKHTLLYNQANSYYINKMNKEAKELQQGANLLYSKVSQVINKNRYSDLFQKAFLKPIEIALIPVDPDGLDGLEQKEQIKGEKRTHKRVQEPEEPIKSSEKPLPYGLYQVIKQRIGQDKTILKRFQSYANLKPEQQTFQYITQNNYDNLISLMKPASKEQKIQLCICICMYSEDKTMLRKTLAGVSNNIATFVKNGVPADDIAVVVVMDGIQKVDDSVIEFFGQMEKESNIYLDEDVRPTDVDSILNQREDDPNDQEDVINVTNYVFDAAQLQDRKERRFAQRIKEYKMIKKTIKKIQTLEKDKNITFDDLDDLIKPFFFKQARELQRSALRKQQKSPLAQKEITDEFLRQKYADTISSSRPIIYKALSYAKIYCEKYIQSRDSLALLNSFRVDVTFGSFDYKAKESDVKYQQVDDEQNAPMVKMNLFFITKYKNSGKLTSHNWFFNGFCKEVWPEFAVLLDVGLCPEKTALFKMYSHMKRNERCGGVCGYMNLRIERLEDEDEKHYGQVDCLSRIFLHFADIQRAQQVEYHFAHLIDKPFEALFKFIHVLPGAFSAYKMDALKLDIKGGSDLMRAYFKSIQDAEAKVEPVQYSTWKTVLRVMLPDFLFFSIYDPPGKNSDEKLLYEQNVYLAEDRTLCMGIHQNNYDLEYLPDAHAWVDPIKSVHGLLGQRKRWINGSFFAFESVKQAISASTTSGRDFCLKIQIMYMQLMNMMAFVSPAFFLFAIHVGMFAFRDWFFGNVLVGVDQVEIFRTVELYNSFVYVIDFMYIMLMLGLVFKSIHMTNKNQRFIPFIYITSTIFGMLSIAIFIVLFVDMVVGIVETAKCAGTSCDITFLASNPALRDGFFNALPGGVTVFIVYKWIVVGVLGIYIIPISFYCLLFCKWEFVSDLLFGVFSFLFYTPTYANILSTFALCRIDDISWGTKGLDSENSKNQSLKQAWKSIKIIHVAKFIFWNFVIGAALLVISSPINLEGVITQATYNKLMIDSYVRKFFMTFALIVIIGGSLMIKILLGAIYSVGYKCLDARSSKELEKSKVVQNMISSRVDGSFKMVKDSMLQQVQQNIRLFFGNAGEQPLSAPARKNLSYLNNVYRESRINRRSIEMAERKKKITVERRSAVYNNPQKVQNRIRHQGLDIHKPNDRTDDRMNPIVPDPFENGDTDVDLNLPRGNQMG